MCIIIVKRKGEKLKEKWIDAGWERNKDGGGFMCAAEGSIFTYKSMDKKEFIENLNAINSLYGKESDIVIHLRFRTHGNKDISNVHPFKVNDDLWFCHNGVFRDIDCKSDLTISDSQHFNNQILKGLPEGFLINDSIMHLVEAYCGSSKLVFLDSKGEVTIVNEHLGFEHCGNWFSNEGYKKIEVYTPPTWNPHAWKGYFDRGDEYIPSYWEKMYSIKGNTSNTVVTETVKHEVNQLDTVKKDSEDMYEYLNRIKE
jgi:glutamine amidotransferase